MTGKQPPKDGRPFATGFGIVLFIFGALVPGLLFPKENQILVGFVGAPFILLGVVFLLIGAFPTQRLDDRKRRDDEPPGPGAT